MSKPAWSDWQPLALRLTPDVLAETLDGGQSFRWQQVDGFWTGTWAGCVVQLRLHDGSVEWRAPVPLRAAVATALPRYLGLDRDWAALTNSLPWRSDAHLAQCLAALPGLRILRQPFGETLLGFLCSATKQIVQIKQMCALLAERHGTPCPEQLSAGSTDASTSFHRLPTWPELALIPEKDLRQCLLGFRAKYIHGTARFHRRAPRLARGNRAPALRRGQGPPARTARRRREGRRLRPVLRCRPARGLPRGHVGAQVPRPPLRADRLEARAGRAFRPHPLRPARRPGPTIPVRVGAAARRALKIAP